MLEHALYYVLACVFVCLSLRKLHHNTHFLRGARILPDVPDQAALPAAPEPVRPQTLIELAGVLESRLGKVMLSGVNHNLYGNKFPQKLLGVFIWRTCDGSTCEYCSEELIEIDQFVRKSPPSGAIDLEVVSLCVVGVYCSECGMRLKNFANLIRLDQVIISPPPEPFNVHSGLHTALEALARDNGRLTKQIRLDMLMEESRRLNTRASEVARALSRLTRELNPSVEGEAYRDDRLIEPVDQRELSSG